MTIGTKGKVSVVSLCMGVISRTEHEITHSIDPGGLYMDECLTWREDRLGDSTECEFVK